MIIPIDEATTEIKFQTSKGASRSLIKSIKSINQEKRDHVFNILIDHATHKGYTEEESIEYAQKEVGILERCEISLNSNNYIYLTADVCDMIGETQKTLKSWNVNDLPIKAGTSGVILFEKPKYQYNTLLQENDSHIMPNIVGILWDYSTNTNLNKNSDNTQNANVLWTSLIFDADPKNPTKTEYSFGANEFGYEITKDGTLRQTWKQGNDRAADESIIHYLAATLMLIQQRDITAPPEIYEPATKHGKRRDPALITKSDGQQEPMRINTVSLSETARNAYAATAGTGKSPTKSWWVKGHWRRQPYGPGSSLRKLIYIHPHISGNVNAPLDERPSMTKVVP